MYIELAQQIIDALSTKFNLIDILQVNQFDHDFQILADRLEKTRKDTYSINDRYLIEHSDTDYYLPNCPYGLSMFNLVRTFLHHDIPLGKVILVTSHKNIKREFEILIPKFMHHYNFPTIIDNCLTAFKDVRLGENQKEVEINPNKICKHGVSMMGVPRVHRNMLYHQLIEKKLFDSFAVSYKGTK